MRWLLTREAEDSTETEMADETSQSDAGQGSTVATELTTETDELVADELPITSRGILWSRVVAYGVLPGLAFALVCGVGYLKWLDGVARADQTARVESVKAASDSAIALLSYRPDTVEKDLDGAKARLTGSFLDAYTSLTRDVVIPGAKQKQISAKATVAAAALTSETASHAAVLLFVNQTVIVGQTAPTNTASSVRVTLDNIDGRWLISQFDPV